MGKFQRNHIDELLASSEISYLNKPGYNWSVELSIDTEYFILCLNDEDFYQDSANEDSYLPDTAIALFRDIIEDFYTQNNIQ